MPTTQPRRKSEARKLEEDFIIPVNGQNLIGLEPIAGNSKFSETPKEWLVPEELIPANSLYRKVESGV